MGASSFLSRSRWVTPGLIICYSLFAISNKQTELIGGVSYLSVRLFRFEIAERIPIRTVALDVYKKHFRSNSIMFLTGSKKNMK